MPTMLALAVIDLSFYTVCLCGGYRIKVRVTQLRRPVSSQDFQAAHCFGKVG